MAIACLVLLIGLNAFATAAATAVRLARRNRLAALDTARARRAEEVLEEDERVCGSDRVVGALTRMATPLLGLWGAALAWFSIAPPAEGQAPELSTAQL